MLALVSALVLAAAPAPAPDVVSFRFGWPDGMKATVDYQRSKIRDGQAPASLALEGRLTAETAGELVRVGFRDWTGPGANDPILVATGHVWTVVSREGAFVRVEGIEPALKAISATFSGVEGAAREPLQRLEKMLPTLLTKEANETWSMLVQFWHGNDLEVGTDYESDSEVPVTVLPGETLRLHATIRVERRLACPGGAGACVEVRMRSRPDAGDVERVAKRLVRELGGPVAQIEQMLGEMSTTTEVILVTDPARLVPHRLEKIRTMTVRPGAGAPPDATPMSGRDATVWTFHYAPAAR
jgi:hypothetical protein